MATSYTSDDMMIDGDTGTSMEADSLSSRFEDSIFTSDYTRPVSRSMDIRGKLPNAIFTLPAGLIIASLSRAKMKIRHKECAVLLCRKFDMAWQDIDENCVLHEGVYRDENPGKKVEPRKTTIRHYGGRLCVFGDNSRGQCGVGQNQDRPSIHAIRLPPVHRVINRQGSWFAWTSRGVFGWGENRNGLLGVGHTARVTSPVRVALQDITDIVLGFGVTIFKSRGSWFGCGLNVNGQLGLGDIRQSVSTPQPIPNSDSVVRWESTSLVTFAFTNTLTLVCGDNYVGQAGVGLPDWEVTSLTPVDVPRWGGRVDRIVTGHGVTFMLTDSTCFACGRNDYGQLCVGRDWNALEYSSPMEAACSVDDVATSGDLTVIWSEGRLLACGHNSEGQIVSNGASYIRTPTPVVPPGEWSRIVVQDTQLFVRDLAGGWLGRGKHSTEMFGNVPGVTDGDALDGWARVIGAGVAHLSEAIESEILDVTSK